MPVRIKQVIRKRQVSMVPCPGDEAPEICNDSAGCRANISNLAIGDGDVYLLATTGTIGGYVRAVVETIGTETTPWQPLGDPIELSSFPFVDGFTITLEVSNDVEEEKYVCDSVTVAVQEYTDEEFEGGEETYNLDSIFTLPACTGTETFTTIETDADNVTFAGSSVTIADADPESQTVIIHRCAGSLQSILVLNTVEAAAPELGLRLTYTPGNLPNFNLAQWNAFFDLPVNGTPFSSMSTAGDEVTLIGGSSITLKQSLFRTSDKILKIEDDVDCVVAIAGGKNAGALSLCSALTTVTLNGVITVASEGIFSNPALINLSLDACTTLELAAIGNCTSVATFNFPALTTAYNDCFYLCVSATTFTLPLLTSAGDSCFKNCSSATTFTLPLLTSAGNSCFRDCASATTFTLPELLTAGDGCFKNCTAATTFTLPLLTSAGNSCFIGCASATTFTLPLLTSADINCFQDCTAATTFTLPLLTSAGDSCFKNCSSATTFTLPLCTTIGDNCFYSCIAATTFNLSACTALGTTTADNSVFFGITGNTITITVPTALSTCNAGSPDGDLVYLEANNTVPINYV